jgi:hypothetical protein
MNGMAQELSNYLVHFFLTGGRWSEMVKSKFLIMIALYAILAMIVGFNFNLYHRISVGWTQTINETMERDANENVEATMPKPPQEPPESLSDSNE